MTFYSAHLCEGELISIAVKASDRPTCNYLRIIVPKYVQIECGKELGSSNGFTLESLHKDGFSAVFLGIGK